jgi:hypothetical protein
MNYEMVLKALRRHVDVSQKAVDFFRAVGKGVQHAAAFECLAEAIAAVDEVEKAQKKARTKVH